MASTFVFLLVRRILGLVGLGPKPDDKDVEIAVLRHQLPVLHNVSRAFEIRSVAATKTAHRWPPNLPVACRHGDLPSGLTLGTTAPCSASRSPLSA
jgi:hypothetical protein